ncbi:gliding motility-associated ABC transporter substrate-binding protein GldG [Nonlabens ponticola]|nr:gliding motility-associated ABC transporter substrate-binding protein GldG [Nonlabens ponticola]
MIKKLVLLVAGLILVNLLSTQFYERIDMTDDDRYTLSSTALDYLNDAELPILIDVFLDGELPAEFLKLKQETRQLLEEMSNEHPELKYEFIDPTEGLNEQERNQVIQQLAREGVQAARTTILDQGKETNIVVFPYAIIAYDGKRTAIPLLKSVARSTTEQRVNSSIQQLEYQLIDGLRKVSREKEKSIAILRDSGELSDLQIADFIRSLQAYYKVAPFGIEFVTTSDSVQPRQVLNALNQYDLVIEAKPTIAFSQTKNYILDQYLMNGGNLLLAADPIIMENDSLANEQQTAYALPRDLNLDEMLFRYGLRLKKGLIKDLQSGPIALATGQGRNTQYEAFKWPYYPIASGSQDIAITKNLEEVKFEYTGSIDTLNSSNRKQILLSSSENTRVVTLPTAISLSELERDINPDNYQSDSQILSVISQGNFTSAFKNRVKPFDNPDHKDQSNYSCIFLSADGDIMKNQVDRGQPLDLGYDLRTGQLYGNKEFLLNVVNSILADDGLINLRNKDYQIAFLDVERSYDQRILWQLLNIVAPILLVFGFGALFIALRKRRYAH